MVQSVGLIVFHLVVTRLSVGSVITFAYKVFEFPVVCLEELCLGIGPQVSHEFYSAALECQAVGFCKVLLLEPPWSS